MTSALPIPQLNSFARTMYPDAQDKWLATMVFDTTYAVKKALKDYHPGEMLNST